ncbi:MAG TPA: DsbA family protein [Baekduia sp.]
MLPLSARMPRAFGRRQMGSATVLALLLVGALVLAHRSSSTHTGLPAGGPVPAARAVDATYAGIPEHGTTLGRPGAPTTLVLYADPQCPFCGRFERDALPDLVSHEVRSGALRVELRPLTFIGPDSERAARTLLAAGLQNRLWPLAALMARYQGGENSGYVTATYLRRLTSAVAGLDVARVAGATGAAAVTRQLAAAKAAAVADHVDATPWLLLGPTGGRLTHLDDRSPTAADVRKELGR